MDNEQGIEAKAHYLSVARRMRNYSASLHQRWYETVDSQLMALLRRTLLAVRGRPQRISSTAVAAGTGIG